MDKTLSVYAAKTGNKQEPWVQILGRSKAKKSETELGSHSVKVKLWEGKLWISCLAFILSLLIMAVRMAEACTVILLLTDLETPARILQHHVTGKGFSFLSLHGIPFLGK